MTVIESAVNWAIQTAQDNRHGYSQADRWGPDYDCSSFVITAYEQAGVPLREAGASYTGNMRPAMIACGFVDVTTQCGLSSGYGIQAGDVLLNYSAHTCISIGNGKVANCRTSEGHPQAGDQSGNEIRIQAYWNFPWNCVLRYKGKSSTVTTPPSIGTAKPVEEEHKLTLPLLSYGSIGTAVALLQSLLTMWGFECGKIDGEFGALTQAAVNRFQQWAKLSVDGIVGNQTWIALMKVG